MAYRIVNVSEADNIYSYPLGYYHHQGALIFVVYHSVINLGGGRIIKYRSEDLGQTWSASYIWQTDNQVNAVTGSPRCFNIVMDPAGKFHITFMGYYDENGLSEKMHEIDEMPDGSVSVKVYNTKYNSQPDTYTYGYPDITKPLVELQQVDAYVLWVRGAGTYDVPVQDLLWSDDVAVTKYVVNSDNSTPPALTSPNWVTASTPPSVLPYVSNGSAGTKNLYVFARDAAGNISSLNPTGSPHPQWLNEWTYGSYQFTVSVDSVIPTVSFFAIGVIPPDYDVPLLVAVTASDTGGSGLAAYLLDEEDNPNVPVGPPALSDPRWVAGTPAQDMPVSYMAGSPNLRIMRYYVKDGAGNINVQDSNSVAGYDYVNDVIYPAVNTFTLSTGNGTTNVATISSFTASTTEPGETIVGYMVTHILNTLPVGTNPKWVAPQASDPGWSGTPPTTYTLTGSSEGVIYLLLAWAKSSSGRISTISRTASTGFDCTAPYSYVSGGGPPPP